MGIRRSDLFKTLLIIGLFTILPALLILVNSSGGNQDIRSKATGNTPTPGQIIFVPFSFSKDKNDDDQLDFRGRPPQIRNGFVPSSQTTTGPQYSAILLDDKGRQLTAQKFSLPQVVAIDTVDKNTGRGKAELRKVSANNQGLTLTYHPNASYLKIINPSGEIVKMISLRNMSSENNVIDLHAIPGNNLENNKKLFNQLPLRINQVSAANGTFNIAIIGDNYNGDNLHFQSDVNDIASGLLSIEPFKSYQSNIVFYPQLSTAQICTYTTSLTCNDTLALQQASAVPYDKVYVLYNGPYAGYAYVGGALSYGTNANDKTTAVKQSLFIHEMVGHTLGGLMDEYSYQTIGVSYAPNCSDSSSCPAWNTIQGLGCYSTCGYTNLFRATDNSSVMNTALLSGFLSFDQFSNQIIQGKLQSFLGSSLPTPTLPPVQPSPTITPVPTATITPTPTPVISPAITPVISITAGLSPTPSSTPIPAPSPSATLTPPQPAECTFPNFCTILNLCTETNILPSSCGVATRVCCKVEENNNNVVSPLSVNATPTVVQQFDPLPTTFPTTIPGNNPTAVPQTPTPITILTPTPVLPTATIQPIRQQSTAQPTTSYHSAPGLITAPIRQQPVSPYIPPPTISLSPSVYIYPSPTPFQVENIIFERVTPTPSPRRGFLDILKAPSLFVNSFFENFFSFFRRK